MSATQDDSEEITGINVTPLVDVMLVLLIIFMVTATYIANRAIQVNLPKAATGEDAPKQDLVFTLSGSSELFLNGKPLSFQGIGQAIENLRKEAPGQTMQALIAADTKTPHGQVIKLIDAVRKNGISEFAINVEQDSP